MRQKFQSSFFTAFGLILALLLTAAAPVVAAEKNLVRELFGSSSPKKVTWSAAIKKTCRHFEWVKSKTYSKCKKYAATNKLLASPIPKKITSTKKATPKQLKLLVARAAELAAMEQPTPAAETAPPTLPPVTASEPPATQTAAPPQTASAPANAPSRQFIVQDFTAVPDSTVAADFFGGVRLSAALPRLFYVDEVYFLEGEVTGSSVDTIFAFLCPGNDCKTSINFTADVKQGRFKIPLYLNNAGNFSLGIITGTIGTSRLADISVLPKEFPTLETRDTPSNLQMQYTKGETSFNWSGGGGPARLIIYQSNFRKDYIFRQAVNSFSPPSKDFRDFKKGAASWFVQLGEIASDAQSLELAVKDFRKIENNEIEVLQLQESFSGPAFLTFKGRAKKNISKRAAVTKPDGTVQEIYFSNQDIAPGAEILFTVDMPKTGTYIFEVNNPEGSAAVNVPIFIGGLSPLLPDFFALNPAILELEEVIELESARRDLLKLINDDRAGHNLAPVSLESDLSAVAQNHSQDMLTRKFFGHNTPEGISPDDRRRAVKIRTPIRENLAKATSLGLVEAGLMRSPVHRSVIVDPEMRRVGLGIAKDSEGYLIVTQNFSGDPLSETDLSLMAGELATHAINSRSRMNLATIAPNSNLETLTKQWSTRMVNEKFFAFTAGNGNKLIDAIQGAGVGGSLGIHILKSTDKSVLTDELLKQDSLSNATFRNIGIGLSVDSEGDVYMTVIYSS